jgi:hypothetical protein
MQLSCIRSGFCVHSFCLSRGLHGSCHSLHTPCPHCWGAVYAFAPSTNEKGKAREGPRFISHLSKYTQDRSVQGLSLQVSMAFQA